jgi:hypothetical protein
VAPHSYWMNDQISSLPCEALRFSPLVSFALRRQAIPCLRRVAWKLRELLVPPTRDNEKVSTTLLLSSISAASLICWPAPGGGDSSKSCLRQETGQLASCIFGLRTGPRRAVAARLPARHPSSAPAHHREFPAGYSSAGRSPAEPAPASPGEPVYERRSS